MSEPQPRGHWEDEFDALVLAWHDDELADHAASGANDDPAQLRKVAALVADLPQGDQIALPASLRARVLDPIRAEATRGAASIQHAKAAPDTLASATVASDKVVAFERRGGRSRRPIAAVAAAVAAIVAALVTFGGGSGTSVVFAADLSAAPGSPSPGASGTAKLVSTKAGLVMRLHATGLTPNPTGAVYQCWYVGPADGPAKQDRISIGRFRTKTGTIDVAWPTAFDPKRYPKVGITLEPDDGDPLRNGPKVLTSLPKGVATKTV